MSEAQSDQNLPRENGNSKVKIKVLIVEDDLCLKAAIFRILSSVSNDVDVNWVTTAQEAMDQIQKSRFDFVIADYLLPDSVNGLSIFEKCKELDPSMPFLLMSGIPVEAFLEVTMGKKSCPSFLPKPFWPGELRETINNMLGEVFEKRKALV